MLVIGYPEQKGWGSARSPGLIQGYVNKTHIVIFELLPHSDYSQFIKSSMVLICIGALTLIAFIFNCKYHSIKNKA